MWWLYVPAIGEQRGQIPERFFRILFFFFSPWGVYLVSFHLNYKLHLGILEWRWQDSKLVLSVYAKHSLCYLRQMRLEGCVVAQINWSAPTDEAPIVIFYCSHRERDKPNFTETMSTYNFTCYFKGGFNECNSYTIIVPHSFIFNFYNIYLVCGGHTYMVCVFKGQRTTCRNRFSPTNMWVLEKKLKSLGIAVNYSPSHLFRHNLPI